MSFLHGVLESVKEDDNVTKYNEYIKLNGDNDLHTVLQHLQSSIGQGRSVFGAQVEKVNSLSTGVTHELGQLNDMYIHNEINSVSGTASKDLTTQLEEWKKTLGKISTELTNIETYNINILDRSLKSRLMHEIKPVQKSVEVLADAANDATFGEQVNMVDETLKIQLANVEQDIRDKSVDCQRMLKNAFWMVLGRIDILSEQQRKEFKDILSAVDFCKIHMTEFDWHYKAHVLGKIDEIRNEVSFVYADLFSRKVQLVDLVQKAQAEFGTLKEKVDGSDKSSPPSAGVIANWDGLKVHINQIVGGLTATNDIRAGTLKDIVNGVIEYATGFEKDAFTEDVLKQWIGEMVKESDTVVSNKMYVYYNMYRGQLKEYNGKTGADAVKEAIKDKLPGVINTEIIMAAQTIHLKDATVENIAENFQKFANQIESELPQESNSSISKAVQAIEAVLKSGDQATRTDTYLTETIKAILKSFANRFKQYAAELKRFVTVSKLHPNLEEAIKKVNEIGQEFENNKGKYGQYITAALTIVKQKINALDEIVKESDGTLTNAVNELDTVIGEIKKLIKESESKTDDGEINKRKKDVEKKMEDLKGQLNSRIKDVELKVDNSNSIIDSAIQAVKQSLQDAHGNSNDAVETLKNSLLARAGDAFRRVRDEIQKLFADGHKADLTALQKLVTKQTTEIKNIIHEDEMTGIKGLLKSANGMLFGINGEGILKFRQPKTTLLDALKTAVPTEAVTDKNYATKFSESSDALKSYLDQLLQYTELQVKFEGDHRSPTKESQLVSSIKTRLDTLLDYLIKITNEKDKERKYAFDHKSTRYLTELNDSISALSPSSFHGFHNPLLLDALKAGMDKFTKELGHAYVNAYSGQKRTDDWVKEETKMVDDQPQKITVLSTEGRNCAKVCLTILERVYEELETLKEKCNTTYGPWKHNKICETDGNKTNKLGRFFKNRGFTIPSGDGSKQDGQLRCSDKMKGGHICQKLDEEISNAKSDEHLKACTSTDATKINVMGQLQCLVNHLHQYFRVGHISSFAARKSPCSVYEMLTWCCGLKFNASYQKMQQHYKTVLEKKKEKEEKEKNKQKTAEQLKEEQEEKEKDAYLDSIMSTLAVRGLPYLSGNSRNILTTILGTGDEHTVYASDFSNNYLNLSYPSSGEACLDTLLDILRRMFPVCRFLYSQCNSLSSDFGWAGCQYGKQVKHANWQCDKHIADKESDCVPRSPLMSYFTDSLPGHLPHQLSSIGCRATCSTCPKSKPGQPCLTPLGFRGFSGSTRLGKDLCNVLTKMLDDADLRSLFCLKPKTPASLPEHFGFVLSLVRDWNDGKNPHKNSIEHAFENSIKSQSIDLYKNTAELTNALRDAYRSRHYNYADNSHRPLYDDLSSLSMTSSCSDPIKNTLCAPYLSSLSCDSNYYLALKHSNTYLSWAIYLPWTFWDLLNNLYNAFCSITCADWGCRGCLRGDKCKSGKHGVVEDDKKADATCQCDSIVKCRGVAPTLYQYGFSFGEASTLNSGDTAKKCKDFCSQLKKVLESEYFQKLFEECDEFLKQIRWPFMCTLLALWSLSLLHLLHIAVVRLDVLRIRSHLKSPSSHRIAAQSLLAAARVKALANVKALKDIDARRISLGTLAGQLSGLIGKSEEVEKAIKNGLQSNVNQLIKRLQASCGGGKCNDHRSQINSLNEKLDKLKNHLNEEPIASENLAEILTKCNLNGHNGPLNQLNEEITEKIESLNKSIEELKRLNNDDNKSKNASEIDKLNKDLQSHNASKKSLETLKGLCEYAEKIDQKSDNTKNLLNNLCGGLEKFLGYQDGNYTGEGIVYSDLDRLCDGVMAFLCGVLSGVKDDDNVTTYNTTQNDINNVITTLHDSVGKGREAFRDAVSQVGEKIKKVTTPINDLLEGDDGDNFKKIPSLIKDIQGMKDQDYDDKKGLTDKTQESLSALDSVDKQLNNKLHPHVSLLHNAVETFRVNAASDHEGLRAACHKIDDQLTEVKNKVNDEVLKQVAALKKSVTEGIDNLKNEVDGMITRQVSYLTATVKKLESIRTNVETAVGHINERFDENTRKHQDENVPCCQKKAQGIYDKASTEINGSKHLGGLWAKIKDELESITDAIANSKNQRDGILDQIVKGFGDYADGFKVSFEKGAGKLVESIVKSRPVYWWLDAYVGVNKNGFGGSLGKDVTQILPQITVIVQQKINDSLETMRAIPSGKQTSVDEILTKIIRYLTSYATEVTGKDAEIMKSIESELSSNPQFKLSTSSTSGYQYYLEQAVHTTLTALQSAAKGAEKDVEIFIANSNIGRLNSAIKKIRDVAKDLQQAVEERNKYIINIRSALSEQVIDPAGEIRDQLQRIITDVKGQIKTLQGIATSDNVRTDKDAKMETQPKTIQGMKKQIDAKITALQSGVKRELDSQVTNVKDKVLENAASTCLNTITAKVTDQTNSAKTQTKNECLKQFVFSKVAELEKLKALVTKHNAEIEKIIFTDKMTGIKAFINVISNHIEKPSHLPVMEFTEATGNCKEFFDILLNYVIGQVYPKVNNLDDVKEKLHNLLELLTTSNYFNLTFSNNLDALNKSLSNLSPSHFAGHSNPLPLDSIKKGLTSFATQLGYTYVSRYSEQTVEWERKSTLPDFMVSDDGGLTQDATKCAKVFFTILNTLHGELSELKYKCENEWTRNQINLVATYQFVNGRSKEMANPLGDFMKRCGYDVSKGLNVCTSELVNKSNMTGSAISGKLETPLSLLNTNIQINDIEHNGDIKVMDLLEYFRELLRNFYRVTQVRHIPAAKAPNTVHQMLEWVCGLRYNPMRDQLTTFLGGLFTNAENGLAVDFPADIQGHSKHSILSPSKLIGALTLTCRHAEKVLSAILGYGNAEGRYGCDYNTNPDDLSYPTSPATCFDWLVEICSRLHQQLYFLYYQCCNGNSSSGWLDCHYGKGVGGSAWNCNDEQCANQKCKQIFKQNCRQHPRCGLKSPLQSFLEDGLQGFLPHPFKKPDCKMSCSVANHRGIPCKTAMGFRNISTVASHTMRGQHLMKALAGFCSNSDKPLTKLCGYLTCLLQKPPQTLDEMLAFYYSFLSGWSNSGPHRKGAFQTAVDNAYFGNNYKQLNPESICDSATHRDDNHPSGDISSIINCNEKSSPVSPCGSYIHPLSYNTRCIYSQEHAEKYLSWIVYLTETFYDYLCRLLSKCEENCGTNESKCRIEGCANDCQSVKSSTHSSSCRSIIQCPHTLPAFYTEGIVFGNGTKIGGRLGKHLKRTCGDFIEQLKKVCGGKSLIAKLIHETIPEYIWTIRQPFSYLLLSLWSLSLLYLLHIAVVRLDVLRIRSHLRSPSSHRIAAQSLLAAARVRALANVKYFSP
ncbi:hypothetical protein, conserved [Babesia ovata]|uniref:C3H1-type domain-containing protein n=1 Tax=Babesia ovata TaxID=189622 RepID=A0A2H6KK62_9APIC|nr:uncharacterized protein BOVATA_048760 [Babesia ovata]GBE63383.1 hypothetical protein, conserved [Babesia ovata]